jgi:hypothetical protein
MANAIDLARADLLWGELHPHLLRPFFRNPSPESGAHIRAILSIAMSELEGLSAEDLLDNVRLVADTYWWPTLLHVWWDLRLIDEAALRSRILHTWSFAGRDDPLYPVGQRKWVNMFHAAGYVTNGPGQPTQVVTVFRWSATWIKRGMSWFLDPEREERLARDLYKYSEAGIWVANVPPHGVLAQIQDEEGRITVVVNPNCLHRFVMPGPRARVTDY